MSEVEERLCWLLGHVLCKNLMTRKWMMMHFGTVEVEKENGKG